MLFGHCALSIDKCAGKEPAMLACHGHAAGCLAQNRQRDAAQIAADMPISILAAALATVLLGATGALERCTAVSCGGQ